MNSEDKEDSSKEFISDGPKKEGKETFREKWNDKMYRRRLLQSFLLSLSSFTLGFVFGQQGSTFLDLQIITGTDVESASFFFTAASFGYMVGSLLSGFLHGKVNNNILLGIINAGAGLAAITTPHCSPYALMIIIRFTTHVFCGGIDTLVNAEHMRIWGTHKDGTAFLQFIHFVFALGGVVTPLITEPFLAPKEIGNGTLSSPSNLTSEMIVSPLNVTIFYNETYNSNITAGTQNLKPRTTNVHYAFLISGLVAIMASIPYFFLVFFDKSSKSTSGEIYSQEDHSRKIPFPIYVFMLAVLCFFYMVYCCIEDTFASFLMTFVVNEYESVSKSKGAYITTFYWASFAAARFGSIFVSKYLTAVRLLYLYTFLMVVSYTGFTISARNAEINALTAFACMAGISMSAVFPAGFSWTEAELFKVTGWVSSFILIGSSLGMMINPMIIGYLMQQVGNMWFCYILLTETFLLCSVFMFLLVFNRCYVTKKFGTVGTARALEIQVDPPEKESESESMVNAAKH